MITSIRSTVRLGSPLQLEALRESIVQKNDPSKCVIVICAGTGCLAAGAADVIRAFKEELKSKNLEDRVDVKETGCPGFCERGPLVVLRPRNIFYQQVTPQDIPEIIAESVIQDKIIDRLLFCDPRDNRTIIHEEEVPFYEKQTRIILGNNEEVDPTSIEDYIAIGGYSSLAKVLFEMTPQEVIDEIKRSKLRGRGGGGFPTGVKWDTCRNAHGSTKYIICNADEGDPGAFMDRAILEGNPHSVLEGMIIGAYAVGSNEGYFYVRNEYPLAVENARIAVERAEELGLLGDDILGSDFSFHVKINRGGGAFVCGESTSLMASLEGKVGEPRAKYIHTVERGLWDCPSTLNNVETWANVPIILKNGADWYCDIGTEESKGTKIFSLVGKINNTGLVEVPMGTRLEDIIFNIGGGIPNGKMFKAVQTGGPSGGCIPSSMLHLPVDFDELGKVGSMMGSGGMIVMDEDTCMVDVAKYFVNFLEGESCGKCVPCREGLKRMGQILAAITEGRGRETDIITLERLSVVLKEGALCALGQTAANPVMSTLQYFRDEYEVHIKEKRCPAGVCRALIRYEIITDKCVGCGLCVKACPSEAIVSMGKKEPVVMDESKCIKCGACFDVCRMDAVDKE
ncbi:MAG: NADH-ubiquinone oxidoreductase-F iron-sulfur binding region domain-containing protein [Chloroflexota bacterium]|nr:NADH-ubiquinone oxidoreductase-F iron-sulfur binding region domain-containing protein [Chloroflexota bacterium]